MWEVGHTTLEGCTREHLLYLYKALNVKLAALNAFFKRVTHTAASRLNAVSRVVKKQVERDNHVCFDMNEMKWFYKVFLIFAVDSFASSVEIDQHIECYRLHCNILDIIFLPDIEFDQLKEVERVVEKWHDLYCSLYPADAGFKSMSHKCH